MCITSGQLCPPTLSISIARDFNADLIGLSAPNGLSCSRDHGICQRDQQAGT